jgi:hypothetical protein
VRASLLYSDEEKTHQICIVANDKECIASMELNEALRLIEFINRIKPRVILRWLPLPLQNQVSYTLPNEVRISATKRFLNGGKIG